MHAAYKIIEGRGHATFQCPLCHLADVLETPVEDLLNYLLLLTEQLQGGSKTAATKHVV